MASFTKKEIKEIAITAPLTGYVSGAGTISATDTILQAIQKLNANMIIAKSFDYYRRGQPGF